MYFWQMIDERLLMILMAIAQNLLSSCVSLEISVRNIHLPNNATLLYAICVVFKLVMRY